MYLIIGNREWGTGNREQSMGNKELKIEIIYK
jgi:hypothetical protein